MANILFLTHIYPYPPDDGGRIVTYNTLKILQENDHNIDLVSFIDPEKEQKHEFSNITQHLIKKSYQNKRSALLTNLIEKHPFTMKKYMDSEVEQLIEKLLNNTNFDYVILDHLHMAHYVRVVKRINKKIPVYLRQHNIESMIMKRAFEKENNKYKKMYLKLQFKKLAKYEAEICEEMEHIFVITNEDKIALMELNNKVKDKKITVVKAGVDLENYKPKTIIKENQDNNIVFLGAMNWLPNENGVIWFVENVLPKLVTEKSNVKLYVVGKNPTDKIVELKNKFPNNIIITGYVEDDKEYISKADVFIVPLFIGGGMRLKILNALAMKKAIITTSIGAEGISLDNSYITADTPIEFYEGIVELLEDNEVRENLENNGYEQVKKYYSFRAVLKPLLDKLS